MKLGSKHTPETLAKIGAATKARTPWNKLSSPRTHCIKCGNSPIASSKRPYCKPCRNEKERKSYNPEKDRNRHLRYWYGVDQEWYDAKYAEQHGCCAICGSKKDKLCVDHCHTTGAARALLCYPCNVGLGHIERKGFLEAAMKYIDGHRTIAGGSKP